jgi:hypothetical protein
MPFQFMPMWAPARPTLQETLEALGLTTNLKLSLDAGDEASYTSGQKWLDRSGNGYDFFRGADGSATASDPTFNGTPGGRSSGDYWSFDGGDYFRYDTTNETWMNNLHKNSASFSLAAWIYMPTAGTIDLFGTNRKLTSNIGIELQGAVDTGFSGLVTDGAGGAVFTATASGALSANAWHFVALRLAEASNTFSWVIDGAVSTQACTYSSPSASNATYTMEIAAIGNGVTGTANGCRMAAFSMWEGVALTTTQLTSIFTATRTVFGV